MIQYIRYSLDSSVHSLGMSRGISEPFQMNNQLLIILEILAFTNSLKHVPLLLILGLIRAVFQLYFSALLLCFWSQF